VAGWDASTGKRGTTRTIIEGAPVSDFSYEVPMSDGGSNSPPQLVVRCHKRPDQV